MEISRSIFLCMESNNGNIKKYFICIKSNMEILRNFSGDGIKSWKKICRIKCANLFYIKNSGEKNNKRITQLCTKQTYRIRSSGILIIGIKCEEYI